MVKILVKEVKIQKNVNIWYLKISSIYANTNIYHCIPFLNSNLFLFLYFSLDKIISLLTTAQQSISTKFLFFNVQNIERSLTLIFFFLITKIIGIPLHFIFEPSWLMILIELLSGIWDIMQLKVTMEECPNKNID